MKIRYSDNTVMLLIELKHGRVAQTRDLDQNTVLDYDAQGQVLAITFRLHGHGELLRVTQGSVCDVAVDIRRARETFGQRVGGELSEGNHHQLRLPPLMAHGFLVTSESTDFPYRTTDYYAPQAEGCLRWDAPPIGIVWPATGAVPQLSDKNCNAPQLAEARTFD